jgi:hypothetical protein
MKTQRIGVVLTVFNLIILVSVLAQNRPSEAQSIAPVLRGRALEILDEQGLVRASIKVHGPETVNGKKYPGAVVLVMGDPRGAPGVKLAASEKGAGLGLSNGQRLPDGRSAGIQLHADDPVLLLIDKEGHERVVRP